MDVLGTPTDGGGAVPGAVKVVRSLTRMVKIDFWLRNPDYLAHELLTELEQGRQPPKDTLQLVASMIGGSAPTLHRYPMAKYLYGAYERPDNALALLASRKHIKLLRVNEHSANARKDYYLLPKGQAAATTLRDEVPPMQWYVRQAEAVGLIPEAVSGGPMRQRQYEHPGYEAAMNGGLIPEITEEVILRAKSIAAQHSSSWPPGSPTNVADGVRRND
ncbi:hypothetical protein J7F02_18460 [Streptomyces sp. ISL-112]|uniref:hypothetical protein n=1 Tax=unclassified Streptomyces TaxID=2593676 RepID=UPI001BECF6A1|nr:MULTISPECIES: hypothetical protein [unclassified Streptomyces]MBT2427594.1 hypothetical protein [Streptomyces sp. ISL-112]